MDIGRRRVRRSRTALAAALLAAALAGNVRLAAHDMPNDVVVQTFARPEGQRFRLLVRAPIAAMRDVRFPTSGENYLDLASAEPALRHAASLWLGDGIAVYENGTKLPTPHIAALRVSLPSDRSFSSYDSALAHATGPPLPEGTLLVWNQGLMDVLFEYAIRSDRSEFSIEPSLARLGLRVVTVLRFKMPDGGERAFELTGDPGLVRLDPRWHQAARRFVQLGFFHILDGIDHLLFLFCLVLPFRRIRPLVLIVTAFTIAHSATLIASAFGLAPDALWFPPLIETLIAASIVFMSLENIVIGAPGLPALRHRWAIALAFGLVHGFGFSFGLRETLQFAGAHILTSLLAFNIGVEIGQILVLLALVPALNLAFRHVVAERVGIILLSAIVAHTAWHWMIERWNTLTKFDWPVADAVTMAIATRWLMFAVIVGGILWLAGLLLRSKTLEETSTARRTGAGR
jgi:HupE/UreJ protein